MGGVVIRTNQIAVGQTLTRSANSAIDSQSDKNKGEGEP
jgi:hypothetical protein